MMTEFFFLGGLLLAWAFGRNNFGNVFGTAVGTGIISLKWAAFLTTAFLLLGALCSGEGTSDILASFIHFTSVKEAFSFSLIVAFMMMLLTRWGIPASVAQISVGALVGWNFVANKEICWDKVIAIASGWLISPFLACVIAFFLFKAARFYLKKVPVPILERDIWVRFLWIGVGSFTAYGFGANNLPVLTMPFQAFASDPSFLLLLFCVAIGAGCLMASRKVIRTLSSKLFPLSSVESLIVGFSGSLAVLLFSVNRGVLPALPVSIGATLVGAIVGVSFGKGGYGLKKLALLSIMASWIWAPVFSGLFCFAFGSIMKMGGF